MENNKAQNAEPTKIHFTLADVLATYESETTESRELCEKLAGVQRDYEYDFEGGDESCFDDEVEFLQKEYSISETAALCLGLDLHFFAIKKTGDGLMGEMTRLCQGLGRFKDAVEDFLKVESENPGEAEACQKKVESIAKEVTGLCNL
ncbi:MAG: hypothetical protein MJY87_05705 [Fibrobacter sp.]|nr:hypothetical protein [Fibrobacter sp.]